MQTTNNILLVRPANFGFNIETAKSNTFQNQLKTIGEALQKQALAEFDLLVKRLKAKGINTLVVEDTAEPIKPDAIFPNNWVSFHANGTVIQYPMLAPNRRYERRQDIIDTVQTMFQINNFVDLAGYEKQNKFLEGTGSVVFDHVHKIAYACLALRTNKALLIELCNLLNYQLVDFCAYSHTCLAIYLSY